MEAKSQVIFFTSLLCLLVGCDAGVNIDGIDRSAWKTDQKGCQGVRQEIYQDLLAAKSQLIGLSEVTLKATLGKPDEIELYKRHQKFYIYYLNPGSQCGEADSAQAGKKLFFRFSALGNVNEVSLTFPTD